MCGLWAPFDKQITTDGSSLIPLEINKTKEIIMKRFALILAALGAFALLSTSAMANDN